MGEKEMKATLRALAARSRQKGNIPEKDRDFLTAAIAVPDLPDELKTSYQQELAALS